MVEWLLLVKNEQEGLFFGTKKGPSSPIIAQIYDFVNMEK